MQLQRAERAGSYMLCRPVQALERAEAALADEWLSSGDRLALQRRVLRLGEAWLPHVAVQRWCLQCFVQADR